MDDLVVAPGVVIPARELAWSAARASGPGGQNVNKVSSKVDLRFDLEGSIALAPEVKARVRAKAGASRLDADGRVVIVSQITRDQKRNLEDAREKLAALVRAAMVVPKKRKKTAPSRGAKERRLGEKKRRAETKRGRQSTSYD
ncbi:alternative ribosome rescue aminoacyl-tRNA hydrolase ArfB [Sandaracinus amylolyticus]|uniref:alternative ribosome rescue aminoacyl-tRNA hydrolase ArfB n=1 Tax=Sandaracinus amylolyticus TaxID=927083 RepID=UPI001EFFC186|nr:alternative ribosome rescue aminoacyl-tRNA hydrolase ArfB [Sandaracinus amylolyticus]